MKKIISAVALAAAAATLATAEVKITMNGRLRPVIFSSVTNDTGAATTTTNTWMSLDGYAGFEDTLKFAWSDDSGKAGLTFSVNVKNGNDKVDDISKADGTQNTNNKQGDFLTLNQYDIWSKVFDTDLKIGAGSWKDGNADGAYRVKKDVDAANAEGVDFERYKLGSMFKGAPSVFVDDICNFAGGSNALAAYAEYPLAVNDDISLKFTAVALKASYWSGTEVDGTDTTNTVHAAGGAGRVQFNMKNTFNSELIIKKPASGITVLAFYAQPTLLKELTATIGGSYVMDSTASEAWDGAWNFDLRARYQVTPELSITTFNNISSVAEADGTTVTKNKANAKLNSGIVGVDGKGGQILNGTDITMAMWNNISARYKINDQFTATLNVGLMNVLGQAADSKAEYGLNFRVTPGVQLYLSKPATLWLGVAYSSATYNAGTTGAKDQTVSAIAIPAIFRVKL